MKTSPMKTTPMNTTQLSDEELIALGQRYFDAADCMAVEARQAVRDAPGLEALETLRDFVPALLHRLREKVALMRHMVPIAAIDPSRPDTASPLQRIDGASVGE